MSKIISIKETVGAATIVAATKYVDSNKMKELLDEGVNHFGENRVNDFLVKYEELSGCDITWHFIGNLQTNKVRKMINKIDYLHSLNSIKLASFIEKYRITPLKCFLEVKLTNSDTKEGMDKEDIFDFLEAVKDYKNVKVIGLMTMTESNMTDIEKMAVFKELFTLKEKLNSKGFNDITELSMGMSDDYKLALEANATFVRLGRILFN